MAQRKGARRKGEVPAEVLLAISAGEIETVNLMEWLAADMSVLAVTLSAKIRNRQLKRNLLEAGAAMSGKGVLTRITIAGNAIARAISDFESPEFGRLATHGSDLVRQWACYAVNDPSVQFTFDERLRRTIPFAADRNMSVREAAWMAFRPHLATNLEEGIRHLEPLSRCEHASIRRFAIEVSRPRSVWGAHLQPLKFKPHMAQRLLENTRADPARYVQLSLGNWLNDASKTQAGWVEKLCRRWAKSSDRNTHFIIRRGTRSIAQTSVQTAGKRRTSADRGSPGRSRAC